MRQILNELYWESMAELEKIHKSKLLLSERIAFEKVVMKLEMMKKILNQCSVVPPQQ